MMMAENCKHGIDRRFCSLCNADRREVIPVSRRSPKPTRARTGAPSPLVRYLDFRFEDDGRTLILTADIVNGWRGEQRKTFCFSEVVDAEWQGGAIHAQLSVFPKPGGLSADWAEPPALAVERFVGNMIFHVSGEAPELVDDCYAIQTSNGIVVASVDVLNEAGERPRSFGLRKNRGGDLMFERLEDHQIAGRTFSIVQVQLRLTFKPPVKPSPVEYSHWNRFLPGGRPESNRHKF